MHIHVVKEMAILDLLVVIEFIERLVVLLQVRVRQMDQTVIMFPLDLR